MSPPYVFFDFFFFQAEDGIRDFCLSRGLGDVYKRQNLQNAKAEQDQADRANERENEITQIVDDRQRITVRRERRDNKNRQHEKHAGEDRVEPFCFGFKWFLQ